MLEIQNVTKRYDGRAVVDRVSAEVHPGEIFALLGPNGAGKTTLIRMITDILKPDEGTIRIAGLADGLTRRRYIAYLPEERGLYKRAKVQEVLEYWGQLKGLESQESRRQARALLERIELADCATKQVQALSKGMQQKVQLCTALIGEPRLLILDEPFSGLDPINVKLLEDILDERRKAGVTVLLSTHQMNKVEELCDRALMIHNGRVVLYGTVRDIRRHHADHAIVIRVAGPVEQVPGVRSIESFNGDHKLMLEPDASPQTVLRALLERGSPIESFQLAEMPLEDVFVKVVRDELGLDPGVEPASATPAAGGKR